jgi:hypothetical protein
MHLEGVALAGLELPERLTINIEVPVVVSEAPDEVREMPVDFVILHLHQRLLQPTVVSRFEHRIQFVARRAGIEEVEQQLAVFLKMELAMIGNFHRLVHEQVPCVSTVPVWCPQEASVRDQK